MPTQSRMRHLHHATRTVRTDSFALAVILVLGALIVLTSIHRPSDEELRMMAQEIPSPY